jgi:hypothetical protein
MCLADFSNVMSQVWDYREKAAAMRLQAGRAETASLRAMYEMIADDWSLQADSLEEDMPPISAMTPDHSVH